jgi:hypothetical protein
MKHSEPIEAAMPTSRLTMMTLPTFRGLKNDPIVTGRPLAMSSTPLI